MAKVDRECKIEIIKRKRLLAERITDMKVKIGRGRIGYEDVGSDEKKGEIRSRIE